MHLPSVETTATTTTALPAARGGGPNVPTALQPLQVSLTAVACFDLAGDGEINTRPALEGGDATLLLPSHAIDIPTWPHRALLPGGRSTGVASNGPAVVRRPVGGHFAIDHAVQAYERYGQSTTATTDPRSDRTTVGTSRSCNADTSDAAAPAAVTGHVTPVASGLEF